MKRIKRYFLLMLGVLLCLSFPQREAHAAASD